jgi:CRP-like cAMP-binding protein
MNAFIRKLECYTPLTPEQKRLLEDVSGRTRIVARHTDLILEGDKPDDVLLILEGFAYRYKILPDGDRQILAFLVPGDFCDLHVALLKEMDHSIATLSDCAVVDIPKETVIDLTENQPGLARALWWTSLVDEAILREWLANMGQRESDKRIAHLLCEIHLRLKTVGLADDHSFEFPVSQQELGDTMGITVVHANRSLKVLRDKGLAIMKGTSVEIPDLQKLRAFGDFNPNYLHLGG